MGTEESKGKLEGGIDIDDVGSGRDTNINFDHVAGRDIVTHYHYQSPQPEQKTEEVAQPLKLPVDLPEVGDLPLGSRMVHRYNRFFVGRETELQALARLLQAGTTAAIGEVAGITGMGGVGKSQLAIALAYRYGRFFPGGVYWVSFANPDAIENEIALCGGLEGVNLREDFVSLELAMQVALVQREWQKPVPRLLIFDNCENERLLEEYRPKVGGCHIIVTSRKGNWSRLSGVQNVPLDTLLRQQSVALLHKYTPEGNPADLDAIAAELGDLPLALHLAGSYLEQAQGAVTPQGYLQRIRTKGVRSLPALHGEGVDRSPTQHELSVWRTFEVSYAGLQVNDAVHRLAQQMLACAAWFQPGKPIPAELLDAASLEISELTNNGARSNDKVEIDVEENRLLLVQARRRLVELGLITSNGKETVTMHRLVGAYVQGLDRVDEARETVEVVVLDSARRLNQTGFITLLLNWQDHLRYITDAAIRDARDQAANLSNTLGYHLNGAGEFSAALPYFEHALTIREIALGPIHPDTVTSLNNLGALRQTMGDLVTSRSYFERAMAINEKTLGPDHPDTARSFNNLGSLLQELGDLAAASPYIKRAMVINEKVLGSEHPDTIRSLNNLGFLHQAIGDMTVARACFERALAIRERVMGPDHPETAESLNNLGALLQAMGNFTVAQPLYERALAINQKVLGPSHPGIATNLNNLGGLLQAKGDLEATLLYWERALDINEKTLGTDHPDTARSLNNLGGLFQVKGDLEAALPYWERALAINEKALGPDHPDTARSLNNLGFLLQIMGDLVSAGPLIERALTIREKSLGLDHPDVANSLNNLGGFRQTMGDMSAAQICFERARLIQEKALGTDHPDVANSLNNLGGLLQVTGNYVAARSCYERVLGIRKRVLGLDHPDTAQSLEVLGSLLSLMGEHRFARSCYEQSLAIREKVLGLEHLDTGQSLNNLGVLCFYMDDLPDAAAYLRRALPILEKQLGPNHLGPQTTKKSLALVEERL